jgi:hypothetical protein
MDSCHHISMHFLATPKWMWKSLWSTVLARWGSWILECWRSWSGVLSRWRGLESGGVLKLEWRMQHFNNTKKIYIQTNDMLENRLMYLYQAFQFNVTFPKVFWESSQKRSCHHHHQTTTSTWLKRERGIILFNPIYSNGLWDWHYST